MITVIWSQDELLAQEATDEARAKVGADGEVITIDAELGLDPLDEALFAGSLFATERCVVIRNAQALKKAEIERLADALHRDGLPTQVVVVAVAERMPSPLLSALDDVGKVLKLQRPRRGELVAWVVKRMKFHGLEPTRDAAPALVEAVGENLQDISNAVDQLALRRGRGGRIDRDGVLEHFAPSAEQPIWILFDAILSHDANKAIATLRRMLDHGGAPLPVLGGLVSQIRGIMRVKSVLERDPAAKDRDIAKQLGLTEGRVGVIRRQCGRLSWDWLMAVHQMLAVADFEIKGGEDGAVLPAEAVLERVVAGALEPR